MASARRIVSSLSRRAMGIDLSTAAGIPPGSRGGIASWRRIDSSTAVKQRRGNKNRHLSTNTIISDNSDNYDRFRSDNSDNYDRFREIGYTDVADLLSTPERDFLVRTYNGQKVPVSSLKGKLIGLYFCENVPRPPRMSAIRRVYEDAKSRGHAFEIVQITFDFHDKDPAVGLFNESTSWLTLSSKDPSFRKIQGIFQCVDKKAKHWSGDSLVLIYPPQVQAEAGLLFELSGAEILLRWGIDGYPFTRPSLYKAEYELQKGEITLQFLFPPGASFLLRPRPGRDGYDLVDAVSQLSGKRVLVLFAKHAFHPFGNFVSFLKSEYQAQLEDEVAKEPKFEVVYVSTGLPSLAIDDSTKDMPWMVQPFPIEAYWNRLYRVFKPFPEGVAAAVAFNEQGQLIAKEDCWQQIMEGHNPQFPFIDQDLEKRISVEVEKMCK